MFEPGSTAQRRHGIVKRRLRCLKRKQRCSPDRLAHFEVAFDEIGCEDHDLGQVVMSEEDYCLCVVGTKHLWHVRFDHFDIWIPPRRVLHSVSSRKITNSEKDYLGLTSMRIPFGSSLFQEPWTTRTCTISRVS